MDIKIEPNAGYIEICGVKYSFAYFERLGRDGVDTNTMFRILYREDGMVTIQTVDIGGLKLPD